MSQFYDSLSDAPYTAMTVHTNAANARQYIEYRLSNPLCMFCVTTSIFCLLLLRKMTNSNSQRVRLDS